MPSRFILAIAALTFLIVGPVSVQGAPSSYGDIDGGNGKSAADSGGGDRPVAGSSGKGDREKESESKIRRDEVRERIGKNDFGQRALKFVPDSATGFDSKNVEAFQEHLKTWDALKNANGLPPGHQKDSLIAGLTKQLSAADARMGPVFSQAVYQAAFQNHQRPMSGLPQVTINAMVNNAAASNPTQSWAQTALGQNLAQQAQPGPALVAFNHALQISPKDPEALAGRSGAQLDLKNYPAAAADAKSALQVDPSNQEATAVLHFSEGRVSAPDESGPSAEAVRALGTGRPSAGGKSESSGGASSHALSGKIGVPSGAVPASGEEARNTAQGALSMNDLPRAMTVVNRALAQDSRNPELLNLRSMIHAGQHDYADAQSDAKAGLAEAPKDSALQRSLGFAQLRGKDYKGAEATANEMIELNPNDPYAYALRAHAYGSQGDRDSMMGDLQRAAELDPSFAPVAAKMADKLQLPDDKDILFLFPGEQSASASASAATSAAPASDRGRSFGLLVGASVAGGLLIALGLLNAVMDPLKKQLTSAFARVTRTGPTVSASEDDEAPAAMNGLLPGTIHGQYEISRQIGVGGMGMVFAGTDRSLGRPVAIKKMREELRSDPREKARFIAEAKTVAALHHPNIVDIYAIAEEGDDVFLVFEYVDGKTVHDLVRASGRLQPELAAKIVRGSADALEYAHARGVIHRDMKPSNMMLDQSGGVKVMDFGIARMAKDTVLRQPMTNTVVGTPPYMAPEQEQGHVRRESDVYALAVCAYEMLTGKLPFVGVGAGMLMNKINMSYAAPSRAIAGLPEALDPVFMKAFQADPDKRHRTPKEFALALESALTPAVRAA